MDFITCDVYINSGSVEVEPLRDVEETGGEKREEEKTSMGESMIHELHSP